MTAKKTETDHYVVIGNPVGHSRSPEIHQFFAQQTRQKLSYELLEAPLDGFAAAADRFFAAGGAGANVTVPFKQAAAEWVSRLDAAAEFAGAVNTIVPEDDGGYTGFNTDGPGLIADLARGLGDASLSGARILVLGAGGAVRGVLGPLAEQAPARLVIANRTVLKAELLAEDVTRRYPDVEVVGVAISEPDEDFDLIINGTSAGLADAVPRIKGRCVRDAFCYDMVYGARTAFCDWARDHGAAATRDGLGMLVEQAAVAFFLWRGVKPDAGAVLDQLRQEIDRG